MKVFVPQYLHKPNKVAMMEMDEFGVLLQGLVMGLILKSMMIFILGIVIFYLYRKGKSKYPRGFLRHIPHIIGLKQFDNFPNIFVKDFME